MAEAGLPRSWLDELVRGEAHWAVLLRFFIVGGFASLLMLTLAFVFSAGLHLPPHIAQGLAHALCIVPTYLCQRTVTFRSDVSHRRGLVGYALMQAPLLAIGSGLAWVLISYLHWPRLEGHFVVVAAVAVTSFIVQRSIIFASRR